MTRYSEWTCRGVLPLTAATLVSLALGQDPASGQERTAPSGDGERGAAVFVRQCALCHTIDRGGANRYGPNLFGIVDRKAATAPDYRYSSAFKAIANWTWNPGSIASFIVAPGLAIPGNRMAVFQGVADKDLDGIIAYLSTQK